jgi:L-ribulose-5-phosphate 4-epimerase
MAEGYIKFNPQWIKEPIVIKSELLDEINQIRSGLMVKGFLGVLPNGIGFGNISVRDGNSDRFIITGSATGGIQVLEASHLALIESISIKENSLVCRGLTAASSESMSHAIIYKTLPGVNAVIHIHDSKLWEKYFNQLPTTDPSAEYGTPEIAFSIERLITETKMKQSIMVMGGHEDGLIAFASNLEEALLLLDKKINGIDL